MNRSKKIRGGGYKETNWLNLANIQYDTLKEVRKNYQSWIKSDKELVDILLNALYLTDNEPNISTSYITTKKTKKW